MKRFLLLIGILPLNLATVMPTVACNNSEDVDSVQDFTEYYQNMQSRVWNSSYVPSKLTPYITIWTDYGYGEETQFSSYDRIVCITTALEFGYDITNPQPSQITLKLQSINVNYNIMQHNGMKFNNILKLHVKKWY